jgi:hypothetical protein
MSLNSQKETQKEITEGKEFKLTEGSPSRLFLFISVKAKVFPLAN